MVWSPRPPEYPQRFRFSANFSCRTTQGITDCLAQFGVKKGQAQKALDNLAAAADGIICKVHTCARRHTGQHLTRSARCVCHESLTMIDDDLQQMSSVLCLAIALRFEMLPCRNSAKSSSTLLLKLRSRQHLRRCIFPSMFLLLQRTYETLQVQMNCHL